MNRRGFLGSILVACAAPAIVRADSLMRIIPKRVVVLQPEFGTGFAAQARGAQLAANELFGVLLGLDGRALHRPQRVDSVVDDYTASTISRFISPEFSGAGTIASMMLVDSHGVEVMRSSLNPVSVEPGATMYTSFRQAAKHA